MTIVDSIQFKADDKGYKHVCAFLGKNVRYSDEEGTIILELTENSVDDEITLEDGDFIARMNDGKLYACIEINPTGE